MALLSAERRDSSALPIFAVVALGLVIGLGAGISPELALLAAVGIGVVGAALWHPPLALFMLIAVFPLDTALSSSADSTLTPIKVVGALCAGAFVLRGLIVKGVFVGDVTYWILGAFLGLALVSSLWARNVPGAFGTTMRYASFIVFYLIMTQVVTLRLLRPVVWGLSISAALSAVIGIAAFASGSQFRATLPNTDPNDFAFVLVTTVPITLWLLRDAKRRWPIVLLVGLMFGGALLTLSRGGLVGMAAAAIGACVLDKRYRRLVIMMVAVLVIAVGSAFVLAHDRVERSLHAKESVAGANVDNRFGAWNLALHLAFENPIGVGPGNFRYHYNERLDTPAGVESINVVHNAYLDVSAELGLVGGALFVTFLGISFVRLLRMARARVGPPDFAAAALLALVTAMAASLTLSEQYYSPFWIFASFAVVLQRAGREAQPPPLAPTKANLLVNDRITA
jgi:putative inorganic carbon (HCO3(-)) transporter